MTENTQPQDTQQPQDSQVDGPVLEALAADTAREATGYLDAVTEVATGNQPESALPVLLLALSQILTTGARLGAIQDVLPDEKFEPDTGPDPDIDAVRTGLANVLEGLDDYADVVDPLTSVEIARGSLSGDIAEVAAALVHGLRHFEHGRTTEALWWWQFSYLSAWGDRAASALRVLLSVLGHLRLDADDEVVAEAQFEALHT